MIQLDLPKIYHERTFTPGAQDVQDVFGEFGLR
jgi:hypothetical protein